MKTKCDTAVMASELISAVMVLRQHLTGADESVSDALAILETNVAISLRVFAKTNPSKLREIAKTVEIGYLLNELGK